MKHGLTILLLLLFASHAIGQCDTTGAHWKRGYREGKLWTLQEFDPQGNCLFDKRLVFVDAPFAVTARQFDPQGRLQIDAELDPFALTLAIEKTEYSPTEIRTYGMWYTDQHLLANDPIFKAGALSAAAFWELPAVQKAFTKEFFIQKLSRLDAQGRIVETLALDEMGDTLTYSTMHYNASGKRDHLTLDHVKRRLGFVEEFTQFDALGNETQTTCVFTQYGRTDTLEVSIYRPGSIRRLHLRIEYEDGKPAFEERFYYYPAGYLMRSDHKSFLPEYGNTYCLYARDASGRAVREQLLVRGANGRDEVTWDEVVEWEGW